MKNLTNGMAVLGRNGGTLFVRLPKELQTPCGTCGCPHCRANQTATPMWDTLAIAIAKPRNGTDTTWTVHMPDPSDARE